MNNFDESYREIEKEAQNSLCNSLTDYFEDIREGKAKKRPLVLYGAGGNCEFAMFFCSFSGITVTCICDSKTTGIYKYKNYTYKIISPEELLTDYKDAFVMITPWQYEQEIYDFLCMSGFPEVQIYFLRHYAQIMTTESFRERHLAGYRWAYNFFTDGRSRQRILDRIRLLLEGKPCPPDSSYQEGYFAFPDIKLKENEVYVDGGAYIGDTAKEFILKTQEINKDYKHIYSFEPDPENCDKAVKNLSCYDKIDVIPYGLSSREAELKFSNAQGADGESSHLTLNDADTIIVPVTSLDYFFADKPQEQWPTIIKMDIEGEEKEALIGARNVIQLQKPRLIICACHKPEDIYELPQTILKIRDDYKFSFWQIGESFWDMILYAV